MQTSHPCHSTSSAPHSYSARALALLLLLHPCTCTATTSMRPYTSCSSELPLWAHVLSSSSGSKQNDLSNEWGLAASINPSYCASFSLSEFCMLTLIALIVLSTYGLMTTESMAVSQKSWRCLPEYYIQLGATKLWGTVADLLTYSLFIPTTFFSLCESTPIRGAKTERVYFRAMMLSQGQNTSLGLNNVYFGCSRKFLLISWFIVLWVQVGGHMYHELMKYCKFSFELWVFEFNFFM